MLLQLKQQYKDRIDYLQSQIVKQQEEIFELKSQIKRITEGKFYEI